MPNGLWYASGGYSTGAGIPSSAFSKGDLLMLTSASSLSRINPLAIEAGAEIAGVALADSTQSLADKVPYLIPEDDTIFHSRLSVGSAVTAGASSEISFDVTKGRYFVGASGTTLAAVTVEGAGDADQSVQSRIRVKLLSSGGLINSI